MREKLRAGELAPQSGHYEVVARDGEHTGIYRRGLKGHRLPPTPAKGQGYIYAGEPGEARRAMTGPTGGARGGGR